MDASFWHNKWENNEIGFHNISVHPLLAKHWSIVSPKAASRVFLPLCGKTRDIAWLLSHGHQIVGVELSELAVQQLFNELDVVPKITKRGNLLHYQADNIDIFVGDIFELSQDHVLDVDLVYDRAALVALPENIRQRYAAHLHQITDKAPQLLICFEYDQQLMSGPPFAVEQLELHCHYGQHYQLTCIDAVDVEDGLKGKCPAVETVWLLQRKN